VAGAWRWTVVAASAGAAGTAAVVLLPRIQLAYASPSLHVAFETAAASIALLAAYLVLGQFRGSRELDALLLGCGLGIMGGVNLFLGALPAAFAQELGRGAAWTSAGGRLLATGLLVAASLAPPRQVRNPRVHRLAFLLSANVVVTLWLAMSFSGDALPIALDPRLTPETSGGPQFVAHPLVHAVQLATTLLFAVAAIGFLRRGERDEISRWLAPACVLAAYASFHYFLFPSIYSPWFYTGDVFRLGFYILLMAGTAREIWRYQRRAQALAVLEERRRIARDLHDGLAQELAYISTTTRALVDEGSQAPEVDRVATAAERALDEARRAIVALRRADEPLDAALSRAAFEVANRVGTQVRLELEAGVHVAGNTREQLVRIVREAVTNAARHGHATIVEIALANGDALSMRVRDNGQGFDQSVVGPGGFGLTSMAERVHSVGGKLRIESRVNVGTDVEVLLPAESP
jgi:signal transduction histidine kinase